MEKPFPIEISFLIPLLPLIGAAIAGFFGAKWLKGQSHWPIWLGVGASAVLSILLLVNMLGASNEHEHGTLGWVHHVYTWIEAGDFRADVGFFFDP